MKAICGLSLKFVIINYINKKYNKQYTLHDFNHVICSSDVFIVSMNDSNKYKINFEIKFD